MERPISQSPGSHLPWLIRRTGRITTAIAAVAVAYLLTMSLPDELNLLSRTSRNQTGDFERAPPSAVRAIFG